MHQHCRIPTLPFISAGLAETSDAASLAETIGKDQLAAGGSDQAPPATATAKRVQHLQDVRRGNGLRAAAAILAAPLAAERCHALAGRGDGGQGRGSVAHDLAEDGHSTAASVCGGWGHTRAVCGACLSLGD